MLKILCCALLLITTSVNAAEITSENLKLNEEQNQKLTELKEKMQQEITPLWQEIENKRNQITEIEKKYFEEFWKMLTDEQKQEFAKLNK